MVDYFQENYIFAPYSPFTVIEVSVVVQGSPWALYVYVRVCACRELRVRALLAFNRH